MSKREDILLLSHAFRAIWGYASYLRKNRFEGALLFSDKEGIVERSGFKDLLPVVDVTRIVQQLPLSKIQRDFVEILLMA